MYIGIFHRTTDSLWDKNHKNSLLWANSSSFDGGSLWWAYVSKLTRPPQPTAISAVPALCPQQGDKPRLRQKPLRHNAFNISYIHRATYNSRAEHREGQQREVRKYESANKNESANSNETARLFLMVYRPRVFSSGATAAMRL